PHHPAFHLPSPLRACVAFDERARYLPRSHRRAPLASMSPSTGRIPMFHVKHSFLTWGYAIRNAKNVKEGAVRDASVDVPYTARPAPVDGKEGIEPMTIAALAQGAQARVRAVRTERAAR